MTEVMQPCRRTRDHPSHVWGRPPRTCPGVGPQPEPALLRVIEGTPVWYGGSAADGESYHLLIPSGMKPTHRLFTAVQAEALVAFANEVWDGYLNCGEWDELDDRIVEMRDYLRSSGVVGPV